MKKFYNHIRSDKGNTYFWVKIILSLFILSLWLIDSNLFIAESNSFIATSLMISLLTTMIYGIIFKNQNRLNFIIFTFITFDIVMSLILLFPFYQSHFLYNLITLTMMASMVFLLPPKQKWVTVSIYLSLLFLVVIFQLQKMEVSQASVFMLATFTFPAMCFFVFHIVESWLLASESKIEKLEEDKKKFLLTQNKLDKEIKLSGQRLEYLSKDLRKKSFEIQNILNLTDQLGESTDSQKIISSFLLTMVGQLGSSHALYIGMPSPSSTYYSILDQKGVHNDRINDIRIYKDSFMIQLLKSTREPLLVNQIPQTQLYRDEKELLSLFSEDLISPISSRNKIIGMFIIGKKLTGGIFTREDMNLVSILTNQASFILEQSKLSEEIYDFYNKTVRSLLKAQEIKDAFSKGHAIRTSQYVRAVGANMGISNEELRNLTYGTILHDIGKIITKDEILSYDKKFNGNDTEIKKKILDHTIVGASILKSVGFMEPVVDMALHHHEWFNGEGYPHQLNGEDISKESRILSVCNAYDAMINDKPYRKSLNKEWAMDQLQKMAGSQFDPEVVNIFLGEVTSNPNLIKLSNRH
jgi:putative nucleotidyltransferase with HDIG domain